MRTLTRRVRAGELEALQHSWRYAADDVWGAWRDYLSAPEGPARALAYECLEAALRIEEQFASRLEAAR